MIRRIAVIAALLMFVSVAVAQTVDQASLKQTSGTNMLGIRPARSLFGLLDMSRINWSHSYSISYFSGGGRSGSFGLLNSTMSYELSSKLHLELDLSVLHNTGSLVSNGSADATLLPGFRLDYRPSDKFFMSLSVQSLTGQPGGWYLYDPYAWRPYGWSHR